jgi:uncharacterized protein (DUF58 family)
LNEHRYTFVEPGRDRRTREQALKQLLREPRSPARAEALAAMACALHRAREINLALDTARQCLEDGAVDLLICAYTSHQRDDQLIEDLSMLANLGRWLPNDELIDLVLDRAYDHGLRWCAVNDARERERRLDTLRRRFDDALAERVDAALL